MKARKFTRQERKQNRQQKLQTSMAGTGLFVYKNITNGELNLPKPTASGQRKVGRGEKFQGDSYYQSWCKHPSPLLQFIGAVIPSQPHQLTSITEATLTEKKLILDQPDTITHQGKVEHIVDSEQKLTEQPKAKPTETLLTEDPLEGVEIILG